MRYFLIIVLFLLGCAKKESPEVYVFAASSLMQPLNEIIKAFEVEHGVKVRVNYASSGTLARQIQQGAQVDLFLSANPAWMEVVSEKSLEKEYFASNQIVFAVKKSSEHAALGREGVLQLIKSGEGFRWVIGDPNFVPLGAYSKEVLQSLHLWKTTKVEPLFAKDASTVLQYLERDEVDLALLYSSDVQKSKGLKIVYRLENGEQPKILYGMLRFSQNEMAKIFFQKVQGGASQQVLKEAGFSPISSVDLSHSVEFSDE